jgi:hypothetical protein
MQQTWMERDLPVLDATVAMLEDDPMVTEAAITERTGFDLTAVRRALEALDGTYGCPGIDPLCGYASPSSIAAVSLLLAVRRSSQSIGREQFR